ncbi:hypothetical protein B0H19DRAFT_185418 [Mycena capillaripes]|nr:hypothetical protein B0H19DRAFT_185418 [Mycena capillaripes]
MSIRLGSIIHLSGSEYENSLEIAFTPNLWMRDLGWSTTNPITEGMRTLVPNGTDIVVMENDWIRINSDQLQHQYRRRICADFFNARSWLAHANHIFNCLDITSNFEDYFLTDVIHYWVELWGRPIDNLPPGYLFLSPLDNLYADMPGGFRIPECAAYWSLDPSGIKRLHPEDARRFGFPSMHVQIEVWGNSGTAVSTLVFRGSTRPKDSILATGRENIQFIMCVAIAMLCWHIYKQVRAIIRTNQMEVPATKVFQWEGPRNLSQMPRTS